MLGGSLGLLLSLLRGLRIVGGLQRGGSSARRLAFGLVLFGALGLAGGASAGTLVSGTLTLAAVGFLAVSVWRAASRTLRGFGVQRRSHLHGGGSR